MPTFTIQCQSCGVEFEFFDRSISNPTKPPCEVCGSDKTEKVIGSPAAHLKGAGFHVNDYKSEKNKQDRVRYVSEPN